MKKNNTIEFRSKFKKVINEADIPAIEVAFHDFFEMKQSSALKLLWKLTYETAGESDETIKELGLTWDIIRPENVTVFRNELRYQYGNISGGTIPEECKSAFSELEKQSDAITANIVFARCNTMIKCLNQDDIQRAQHLLMCDQERMYFGGIKALWFKREEAMYLKPFHVEIGKLVDALYKATMFGNHLSEALGRALSDADAHLPEGSEEPAKETEQEPERPTEDADQEKEEASDETKEEVITEEDGFAINGENVLYDRELFKRFVAGDLNSLYELRDIGYDLNEVADKSQAIAAFIKAVEELEK